MDSSFLFWPFGAKGMSDDWGHLMEDFADDQELRFFRSGPVCQEPVHVQLCLRLRKRRKRLIWLLSTQPRQLTSPGFLKLSACTAYQLEVVHWALGFARSGKQLTSSIREAEEQDSTPSQRVSHYPAHLQPHFLVSQNALAASLGEGTLAAKERLSLPLGGGREDEKGHTRAES